MTEREGGHLLPPGFAEEIRRQQTETVEQLIAALRRMPRKPTRWQRIINRLKRNP